jgi:hypothetical protein
MKAFVGVGGATICGTDARGKAGEQSWGERV